MPLQELGLQELEELCLLQLEELGLQELEELCLLQLEELGLQELEELCLHDGPSCSGEWSPEMEEHEQVQVQEQGLLEQQELVQLGYQQSPASGAPAGPACRARSAA